MYQHKTEVRSYNHFCCRKEIVIFTYSGCISVALVIQHAKRMRRIIVSSVVRVNVQYLLNRTIFGGNKLLNRKCAS